MRILLFGLFTFWDQKEDSRDDFVLQILLYM